MLGDCLGLKSMQATQIILKGLGGAYSWVKTFNLNQTKTNYSDFLIIFLTPKTNHL